MCTSVYLLNEGLRAKVGQSKIILEIMHELHKNAISAEVGC